MTAEASAKTRSLHARVVDQCDRLLELAGDPSELERRVPKISAWSVGEQLEHLARVDRSVSNAIERILRGEAADAAGKKPSWPGRLLLFLGWVPRGRGKAPGLTKPKGVDAGELATALATEKQRFVELDLAAVESAEGTVPHFFFGPLTAVLWLRFIAIHHHHHWKIIRDIRRSG